MAIYSLFIVVAWVSLFTAVLLHRYGNWRKQTALVTLAAYLSWFFPFLIIFVMPLDVCNTRYRQCLYDELNTDQSSIEIITQLINSSHNYTTSVIPVTSCLKPWSYVSDDVLPTFWYIVYWTSQLLTWMLLPIMQSYARAGDFCISGKLKTSLIENALYYGIYMMIFIVCLIYLVLKPSIHVNASQLKVLAITSSNTWGLTLLVLLLGYGLVDIPRYCWSNAKKDHRLRYTYFKLAKLSSEKLEAEESLEDVLQETKRASELIKRNHPSRRKIDTILSKCPDNMRDNAGGSANQDYETFSNGENIPTDASLIRLHKQVIATSQAYLRTQCQWSRLIGLAFQLEDLQTNMDSRNRKFVRSFSPYNGMFKMIYTPTVEWYWRCRIQQVLLQITTVCLILTSVVIILSECLFFVTSPVLSICALLIQTAHNNYLIIEVISYIVIVYMCVCAYYSVFKIRIFNYYYISADHMTSENSLIFAGMLLCRLTPPLCLNFLGMIHLDSHLTKDNDILETSYSQIMGHMDVIPFISDGFNIYFPIAVLGISISSYFHLGSRILTSIGVQQFINDDSSSDNCFTSDLVDEGRAHTKRATPFLIPHLLAILASSLILISP